MSAALAIIKKLKDTTLITDDVAAAQIRHLHESQESTKPYIIVRDQLIRANTTNNSQNCDEYEVTIIIVASRLKTSGSTIGTIDIGQNIRTTLHNFRGTSNSIVVQDTQFDTQDNPIPIATGDDDREYELEQSYTVWVDNQHTFKTTVTSLSYTNDQQYINASQSFSTLAATVLPSGATGTFAIDSITGISINASTGLITLNKATLAKDTIHTPTITFTASGDYYGTATYKMACLLVKNFVNDELTEAEHTALDPPVTGMYYLTQDT